MTNNHSILSDFDSLLTKRYQDISKIHWTPTKIIEIVIQWCVENNTAKILDIGSGVGKFCFVGALISNIKFTGVEKRKSLHKQAVSIQDKLNLKNINFINTNILNIDFTDYDTFYYFNPFFEQIYKLGRIDKSTRYQPVKFLIYQEYVYHELNKKEIGTKIITYCAPEFQLPDEYTMKNMMFDGLLQLWIKEK